MIFGNYARYYDLLYKEKDYSAEARYIDSLIRRYNPEALYLLDIGCGTGRHANELCKNGYLLTGIDLSNEMIQIANKQKHNNANFYLGNAVNFDFSQTFDVITSLFHVVSYQTTNNEAMAMFTNVAKHLKSGGLFIFDFWYGPAVLTERPEVRIKRLEDETIKVTRIAEPKMHCKSNIVDVNYELQIFDKASLRTEIIQEKHSMRYYFEPELNIMLEQSGIKVLEFEEWMSGQSTSFKTWGICCIAQKE